MSLYFEPSQNQRPFLETPVSRASSSNRRNSFEPIQDAIVNNPIESQQAENSDRTGCMGQCWENFCRFWMEAWEGFVRGWENFVNWCGEIFSRIFCCGRSQSSSNFLRLSPEELKALLDSNPFPFVLGSQEEAGKLFRVLKHLYAHETQAAKELVHNLTPKQLVKTDQNYISLFEYAIDAGEYSVALEIFNRVDDLSNEGMEFLSQQIADPIQKDIVLLYKCIKERDDELEQRITHILSSNRREEYFSLIIKNSFLCGYFSKNHSESLHNYIQGISLETLTQEELLNILPFLPPQKIFQVLQEFDPHLKTFLLNEWNSNEQCPFKDTFEKVKQNHLDQISDWESNRLDILIHIDEVKQFIENMHPWNLAAVASTTEGQAILGNFLRTLSEYPEKLHIVVPGLSSTTFCEGIKKLPVVPQARILKKATEEQKQAYLLDFDQNLFSLNIAEKISKIESIQVQIAQKTLPSSEHEATRHLLIQLSASLAHSRMELERLENSLALSEVEKKIQTLQEKIDAAIQKCKSLQESLNKEKPQEEIPDEFICGISLDLMEDPVVTPCGHYFDKANILNWLNTGFNQGCPSCRGPISENTLAAPSNAFMQRLNEWKANHN